MSFHNLITPAINTYTKCNKSYGNSFYVISAVFCLVCVQMSSYFPTDSTEPSYFREVGICSVSLEILLSWGWKLHSQGPTIEPSPEVSECGSGHLPLLAQNGFGACLYNICSFTLSRAVSFKLFARIFVFSKHFLFLFMHQS